MTKARARNSSVESSDGQSPNPDEGELASDDLKPVRWIIELLIDHAGNVRFSEADFELLCSVADTSEDVGLENFATTSWHYAADQYATSVSFEINTPNGFDARVAGTDRKTGRTVVSPTALKRWLPEILKAIRRHGEPNFPRLRFLLAQEYTRAVRSDPSQKCSLESSHRELLLGLTNIQSLLALPSVSAAADHANVKPKCGSQTVETSDNSEEFIEVPGKNCSIKVPRTCVDHVRIAMGTNPMWKAKQIAGLSGGPGSGSHQQRLAAFRHIKAGQKVPSEVPGSQNPEPA